jgi:AmiR/NasT family two-component response regulator
MADSGTAAGDVDCTEAWAACAAAHAEVEQMKQAMASRAGIEQAKGILMSQRHCGPDEAFAILVKLSSQTNRKLRDVAAAVVEHVLRAEPAPRNGQ